MGIIFIPIVEHIGLVIYGNFLYTSANMTWAYGLTWNLNNKCTSYCEQQLRFPPQESNYSSFEHKARNLAMSLLRGLKIIDFAKHEIKSFKKIISSALWEPTVLKLFSPFPSFFRDPLSTSIGLIKKKL